MKNVLQCEPFKHLGAQFASSGTQVKLFQLGPTNPLDPEEK